MGLARTIVRAINRLNAGIGAVSRYLIVPLVLIVCWEVFMRYVFGRATTWAHELSAMVFAVYFLIGGPYTQYRNAHVNVDVLYGRLSPRGRAVLDLLTWTMFYLFCGILFYKSIDFAWQSVMRMEKSNSVWEPYIWPVKLFLPISAFLILLQGAAKTISDISVIVTGRPIIDATAGRGDDRGSPS